MSVVRFRPGHHETTSHRLWEKLSAEEKQVFQAAAKSSVVAQRKKVDEDEVKGIAQLEKEGMQIVKNVDRASFIEAFKPAMAAYAKQFGAENIKRIQDVK